jgi:hypothetical protein
MVDIRPLIPLTIDELNAVRTECLRMSQKKAFLSAAASIVPIPFTGMVTDVVLLQQIIPAISEKFGLSKEQIDEYHPQIAILIYDIAKRLGSNMIGQYITKAIIIRILKKMGIRLTTKQAAKYVPVLGQMVSAGISFLAMRAIIHSHISKCYEVSRTLILMEQGVTIMEDATHRQSNL